MVTQKRFLLFAYCFYLMMFGFCLLTGYETWRTMQTGEIFLVDNHPHHRLGRWLMVWSIVWGSLYFLNAQIRKKRKECKDLSLIIVEQSELISEILKEKENRYTLKK